MRKEISNQDKLIDSRDVIKGIEELEGELESLVEELKDKSSIYADEEENTEEREAARSRVEEMEEQIKEWKADYQEELDTLWALQEEAEGYCDWGNGETLIRDDYFETYAQELAEDCGIIGLHHRWPLNHIDWRAAAEELKQDYTSVDFGGEEYWVRCN